MGELAKSPMHYEGCPTHMKAAQTQKWPIHGRMGYIHPAVWGVPNNFRAGEKIKNGQQVGGMATSPLPWGVSNTTGREPKSEVVHK